MAAVKKIHVTWAQGEDQLPERFRDNLNNWLAALPGWELVVWDIPAACKNWPDFAKYQHHCFHHATRSDLIQTRVLRDIGGLYIGTDSAPAGGFHEFVSMLDHIDSHLVVDPANSSAMNCLAYSDGKNVDFWDCAANHQIRDNGKVLGMSNVHCATGPGCLWQAYTAHQWAMNLSSIRKAYTHHWKDYWGHNDAAYVNPGYAASWHKRNLKSPL